MEVTIMTRLFTKGYMNIDASHYKYGVTFLFFFHFAEQN